MAGYGSRQTTCQRATTSNLVRPRRNSKSSMGCCQSVVPYTARYLRFVAADRPLKSETRRRFSMWSERKFFRFPKGARSLKPETYSMTNSSTPTIEPMKSIVRGLACVIRRRLTERSFPTASNCSSVGSCRVNSSRFGRVSARDQCSSSFPIVTIVISGLPAGTSPIRCAYRSLFGITVQ